MVEEQTACGVLGTMRHYPMVRSAEHWPGLSLIDLERRNLNDGEGSTIDMSKAI